jgi:hypothetical protein
MSDERLDACRQRLDLMQRSGRSHDDDLMQRSGRSHDDDLMQRSGRSHDDDLMQRSGRSHDDEMSLEARADALEFVHRSLVAELDDLRDGGRRA